MKNEIFRVSSISELCKMCGFDKPTHPLIYIVDVSKWEIGAEHVGVKYTTDLYSIALKDKSCGIQYGRHSYDFDEGVLICMSPNQVTTITKEQKLNEIKGWMLFFHPDLIRNTNLGDTIDKYTFFSYDVHEALHLSEKEQKITSDLVEQIKNEITERIDNHSKNVVVSSIELLLNYCMRFYERQFNTRTASNNDILSKVDDLLKQYYQSGLFASAGAPTVQYLADKVHLSQHYLSDLLTKETGRSAKEHINDFIVEKAKSRLLSSQDSVSEIAYFFGFNYPHYFSRLFKSKTGLTPKEYRESS